jgi:glucose-1-phosphate thymidylyltransferase
MGIRGMIASGGTDSNLRPVTMGTSQELLAVYDKPMIYGPVLIRPDLLGERMAE